MCASCVPWHNCILGAYLIVHRHIEVQAWISKNISPVPVAALPSCTEVVAGFSRVSVQVGFNTYVCSVHLVHNHSLWTVAEFCVTTQHLLGWGVGGVCPPPPPPPGPPTPHPLSEQFSGANGRPEGARDLHNGKHRHLHRLPVRHTGSNGSSHVRNCAAGRDPVAQYLMFPYGNSSSSS